MLQAGGGTGAGTVWTIKFDQGGIQFGDTEDCHDWGGMREARVPGAGGGQQLRPACTFDGPISSTYIADCVETLKDQRCKTHSSLAAAEAVCGAAVACGGVTEQYGGYSARASNTTTPSPAGKKSTSWLITNWPVCHGPPPPPTPPGPKPPPSPKPPAPPPGPKPPPPPPPAAVQPRCAVLLTHRKHPVSDRLRGRFESQPQLCQSDGQHH